MKRLSRLAAACVAFAALNSLPASAQQVLKMNISIAQNSHYGVAIDKFAQEVEKRTAGRYKCRTFIPAPWGLNASRSKVFSSAPWILR